MTPELDEMNARVQEWMGWWKPEQGRERRTGFESSAGYKVVTTVEYEECPKWTAETAMRALEELAFRDLAPCLAAVRLPSVPFIWVWECSTSDINETDPDPIIAVLRVCDKMREIEAAR